MSRLKSRYQPNISLTGRHWRSMIYLSLLGTALLVLTPWSILLSPFTGLLVGFLLVAGIVIWMQLRISHMQSRIRRLEHQVHRLSHQKVKGNLGKQAISHLEAERYFSHDQTRH